MKIIETESVRPTEEQIAEVTDQFLKDLDEFDERSRKSQRVVGDVPMIIQLAGSHE